MLLPHARTLAQARCYLAALADQASTVDASSAYEHVLIELDRVHGDQSPAAEDTGSPRVTDTLVTDVISTLEDLESYGVDPLHIELLIGMLTDAATLDAG